MVRRFGPIENLYVWVLCQGCGHAQRLDPRNLIVLRGAITLHELKRQLRCRRCGKSRAAIVVDDEEQPSRN